MTRLPPVSPPIIWLPHGEGNGTPLQYSHLENPMDRGAWWAAIYGATQSRTRLKRLSSSSSRLPHVLQPYLPTLGPVHLCSLHLRCSLQAFCVAGSFSAFRSQLKLPLWSLFSGPLMAPVVLCCAFLPISFLVRITGSNYLAYLPLPLD